MLQYLLNVNYLSVLDEIFNLILFFIFFLKLLFFNHLFFFLKNTNILSQNNQTVQNNSNNNSSHPTATPSQSTTNTTTTTSNTANNNTTNTTSTTSTTSNNATTNLSADQNVAITNLNSYKAKSELRDLHTHFQGMGTRDFWMSLVRNADSEGKSLRIEENALEDKDSEVKFHITSFGDLRKHVLNHQCTLKLLNHITQKDFTKKQYEEWTTEIQDALTAVQDKRWKEIFRTFTYDIVFSIYHLRTASLHPEVCISTFNLASSNLILCLF